MKKRTRLSDLSFQENLLFSSLYFFFGLGTCSALYLFFSRIPLLTEQIVWPLCAILGGGVIGVATGKSLYLRFRKSMRRPRLVYALLQILFGLTVFITTAYTPSFPGLVSAPLKELLNDSEIFTFWLISTVFLISALGGGLWGFSLVCIETSIPSLAHRSEELYTRLHLLWYLGGILGVTSLHHFFVPNLGIILSSGVAILSSVLSAACGAVLTLLGRYNQGLPEAQDLTFAPAKRLHLATALSGALFMGQGIIYVRIFLLFGFDQVDILSTLLVTTLFAFGLGSAVASTWMRRRGYFRFTTPITALLACLSSILLYQVFFLHLENPVFKNSSLFDELQLRAFVLSALTALLSGVLVTSLRSSISVASMQRPDAKTLHRVTFCCGAALGTILAGFVILPALGLERSLLCFALGYVIVALFCLERPSGKPVLARSAVLALVCLLVIAWFPFGLLTKAYYPYAREKILELDPEARAPLKAVWREGLDDTLMIFEYDLVDRILSRQMLNNGTYRSGSTTPEIRASRMLGFLPLAFHIGAQTALQLELGFGDTSRALLSSPRLSRLDLINSSSFARFAVQESETFLEQRVQLIEENAWTTLEGSDERYDLIVVQQYRPEIPKSHIYSSVEYFHLLKSRMKDGSALAYRLPVRRLSPESFGSIVATFCSVFADCSLWKATPFDYILLSSTKPTGFSQLWAQESSRRSLVAVGLETPEQLLSTFLAGPKVLGAFQTSYPLRTVDKPDKQSPADDVISPFFLELSNFKKSKDRFEASEYIKRTLPTALTSNALAFFSYEPLVDYYINLPHRPRKFPVHPAGVKRVLEQRVFTTLPLWMFSTSSKEVEIAQIIRELGTGGHTIEFLLGASELSKRNYLSALGYLSNALTLKPDNPVYITNYAYGLCLTGQQQELQALLENGESPEDKEQQAVLIWLKNNC